MRLLHTPIIVILASTLFSACQKYLEIKPNKQTVIPQTLKDLQALLDNTDVMNRYGTPSIGEVSADDYWVEYEEWQSRAIEERNAYVWAQDIFETAEERPLDWFLPYQQVTFANIVLERINEIDYDASQQEEWDNVKGSALFHRAWAHYHLALLFCKPYDSSSAENDLGIPLRTTSDIHEKLFRASLKETYGQILTDLKKSSSLLPVTPLVKTRPGKPAAYALLAKTYLQMGDYGNSLLYADSCLQFGHELVDYNLIDTTANFPFERFNPEVIFHNTLLYRAILSSSTAHIDSILYQSYLTNDLRRSAFFWNNDGSPAFKGSYDGSRTMFSGIALDEVYLIRAECYARTGHKEKALEDLNMLLKRRFKEGTFIPVSLTNPGEVLTKILLERRKELVFRGIRWADLRRLNRTPVHAVQLKRVLDDQIYTLPPGDQRYVLPIPHIVIELNDLMQNPR